MKNFKEILNEGEISLMSDVQLKEFDVKPLEIYASKIIGKKVKIVLKPSRRGSAEFETKLSPSDAGVFKNAIKSLNISTFNTSYDWDQEILWMTISLRYDLKDGGSNGISLFTAWYEAKKKKWTFK